MIYIGTEGAKKLALALHENATFKEVKLSYNKIGDEGAAAFADGLRMNTTLTKFDQVFQTEGFGYYSFYKSF